MKVEVFGPAHAPAMLQALQQAGIEAPLLKLESFRQHYFGGWPGCRLYLLTRNDGRIAATLGSEEIVLRTDAGDARAGVLSNTYSIEPGAIAFLFRHWMTTVDLGLCFAGNALLDGMLARQPKWQRVHGLQTFWLNWDYPARTGEPVWKRGLRPLLRWALRRDCTRLPARLRADLPPGLSVREVPRVEAAMLPTDRPDSPFSLRPAADAAWLQWRFPTDLAHVRYRVFAILRGGVERGFVVMAEWPHCILLAQGDAVEPDELAGAVVLAAARLNTGSQRWRKVIVGSMHDSMQARLQSWGFRPAPNEIALYVGQFGAHKLDLTRSKRWLVNLELGDIGLMTGRAQQ